MSRSYSQKIDISCLAYGVDRNSSGDGTCLLLNIGEHRILLDCGIEDLESRGILANPPEFVFCSHAHYDHCQGLFSLHQAFPQLPIYTSEVTAKLLSLYWSDESINDFCNPLDWRSPVKITENLQLELFPAGHLPGASAIVITYHTKTRDYKVMYTGDFSLSNFQLVEGMSIENFRELHPDILIIEGTYGNARHPHRRQLEKQLTKRIEKAIDLGINVLLPVPPIGLAQEILKLLRSHHQFTGRDIDIWVDSNISRTCDIYLELLSEFPTSVQNFAKHQSLFWDERVCPRMAELAYPEIINTGKLPCIVFVDCNLPIPKNLISDSTEWLILLPEDPDDYINLESLGISQIASLSNTKIETYLLPEHSDGRNTTQLIHNLRPQHILLHHGSLNNLLELADLQELYNRYKVYAPSSGSVVEFTIGDRFIRPKDRTPTHYEGEIEEKDCSIAIVFPDILNEDPRWNKFADTGIIEAYWQGDRLVLRGITQKELLKSNKEFITEINIECCDRCLHYNEENLYCENKLSPLFGFKVVPEGYCPAFSSNPNPE